MKNEALFQILEKNFLSYADLKDVPTLDNGECFVSLSSCGFPFTTSGDLITPSTGNDIYVRQTVALKLQDAQKHIQDLFPNHRLQVVYGYRSLTVQQKTYEDIKSDIQKKQPELSADALNEEVHRFIAVPSVAGHPTGGAVDVRVIDELGQPIEMGTQAQEFVKESYSFFPLLPKPIWLNRQKLRQAMLSAGFAPFDGEWWHFSYGDKEWAKYYNKPGAIYTQVSLSADGQIKA